MKVLLDTNVCIAVMRGNERAVARLLAHSPADCAVSVVTVYELYTGIEKCQQPERERAKVLKLLSVLSVLKFDDEAAKFAAQVRAGLEKTGKTCGPYDLLLAGHALSRGMTLVTNNVGEFSRVKQLMIDDWLA